MICTCVKLNSININIFTIVLSFILTLDHQKSAVYKAPLVCTVVNQKKSILLQLLNIQYFHFTEEMLPIGLWPTTLILNTTNCSFHYQYSIRVFAHFLPLFDIIVFSYKRSPFLHKNVMLHECNSIVQVHPL